MSNIYDTNPGESIYGAIDNAKKYLKDNNYEDGKIRFNDLVIPLSFNSVTDDIAIIYNLMSDLRRLKQ